MTRKMDSPCLFCGGLPCTCDTGQKKKSSTRTRKASSVTVPTTTKKLPDSTPSPSATEASTEDVFGAIPEQVKPKFKSASRSDEPRDLSYESALRAIRPLVCPSDQRKIDEELSHPYPQDLDKRVERWKANHV